MKKIEYLTKILRTKLISDHRYLKKKFMKKLGYTPNFKHPQSFNEKINYRILFDRSPIYTKLADKYFIRQLVTNKIGEKYLVPIISVHKRVSGINLSDLPDKFVIKCTHDSGSAIICTNKSEIDIQQIKQKINQHLKKNMYVITREWHYHKLSPLLMIEQYIPLFIDDKKNKITACRNHCFEGKVKYIEIDIVNADGNEYTNVYDTKWILQPLKIDHKENTTLTLPSHISETLELSEKLCLSYGYTRVDFLLSIDKIFFSEITLTPNAGRMPIKPIEWDYILGSLWYTTP